MSQQSENNERRVLYIIEAEDNGEKRQVSFPPFEVLFTHNGWWIDRSKVMRLIEAYRAELNDVEACGYAGISVNGLQYFQKLHPEFSNIKEVCRSEIGIAAKFAIKTNVNKKAEWYLNNRRNSEYSTRQEQTGAGGAPLHPSKNEIVFRDMSGKPEQNDTGDSEGSGE